MSRRFFPSDNWDAGLPRRPAIEDVSGWIETDEMTAIDVHGQIHFGIAETHATLSR